MFKQENKDFSDKHYELFSMDAMKQLEKDFQFFDTQLDKNLLPQAKESPFSQFGKNIFADLKPEEVTKEILTAMRKETNSLKEAVEDVKRRKAKPEGKEKEKFVEEIDQIVDFLLPDQAPKVDNDRKLFLEMLYPDIHFQVDQQLIPAHRYILLTRCPSFGRMFTSGMMESKTSVIKLNDVRPATFQAFLEFIYCGDVRISDFEVALELLNEADKYFLAGLKMKIGRYLKTQINMENVIEIANLAELHEVDQCRDAALKFILSNFDALFESKHQLTDLLDPCLIQLFKKHRRSNKN